MNKQEQILGFFDEELNSSQEKDLFTSLASDENFRNEFKNHFKMEKSIYENMNDFTPNANQSAGVFAGLGLSPVFPSNADRNNRNWFNYLLVGAGTALTTIMIMLILFNNGDEKQFTDKMKNSSPLIIRDTIIKHLSPEKIYAKQKPKIKDTKRETGISKNERKKRLYYSSKEEMAKENNNINSGNNSFIQRDMPENEYVFLSLDNLNQNQDMGLSLEVFTSTYWFYPEHRVPPVKYSNLNRLGAAVYYYLTDDLSLGLDIRRETFEVSYRGMEYGQYFKYYQQPNLTTVGLNARYDFWEIYGFDFFAKMNWGWNLYGYLFRPAVGMKYFLSENVYLMLDLEYSQMIFKHQNEIYSADKFGFNYGINVKF